eukprot:203701_1
MSLQNCIHASIGYLATTTRNPSYWNGFIIDDLASSNVGFLPHKIHKKEERSQSISPSDLKRFENWNHPFKNIRSLCHFTCEKPSEDLRYPYYAWEYDLYDSEQ